jgi:hypothetical protein
MQNMRLVKKDKPEFFSLFLPSVFLVKKTTLPDGFRHQQSKQYASSY